MTIFSFMHVVWTLLAEKSKLLCCLHNHLALLLLLLAPVNLGQSETQVLFPCVIILPLIGVFFLITNMTCQSLLSSTEGWRAVSFWLFQFLSRWPPWQMWYFLSLSLEELNPMCSSGPVQELIHLQSDSKKPLHILQGHSRTVMLIISYSSLFCPSIVSVKGSLKIPTSIIT